MQPRSATELSHDLNSQRMLTLILQAERNYQRKRKTNDSRHKDGLVLVFLVVLVDSRVQVSGEIDTLLATHFRITGPRRDQKDLPRDQHVVTASHTDRQSTYLIRTDQPAAVARRLEALLSGIPDST